MLPKTFIAFSDKFLPRFLTFGIYFSTFLKGLYVEQHSLTLFIECDYRHFTNFFTEMYRICDPTTDFTFHLSISQKFVD